MKRGSQKSIKEKKEAKKAWDKTRNENTKKIYKEKKSKAKKAVAMAKGRAYDNLFARLKTKEGEKELYRLARQRDRAGKDVQHVRIIKDENGRRRCLKRYPLQVRHKQDWGRGFILLLPQNAALPGSEAGSGVIKPASSFVIQNRQTSCSMWCSMYRARC